MKNKFFISIVVSFFSKNVIAQCNNCGVVIFKLERFDSSINKYIHAKGEPDIKMYYKDSIVIIPTVESSSKEENGIETDYREKDRYYTYVNLRSKCIPGMSSFTKDSVYSSKYKATFYEYPAFSKDSFFTRKYMELDTAIARTWVFWGDQNKKLQIKKDSIIIIPDTIINGTLLKREKHFKVNDKGQIVQVHVSYYRCEVEDWMRIFVTSKNTEDCIFIRIDWKVITMKQPWLSQQHEFLSRKLTKEEIEIFDAWEKNEKNYPVTK